eukprot:1996575-Pyramimonas_sp.AAC.1
MGRVALVIQSRPLMVRPLARRCADSELRHAQAHAQQGTRATETHSHSNSFTIRFVPSLSIPNPVHIRKPLRLDIHGG